MDVSKEKKKKKTISWFEIDKSKIVLKLILLNRRLFFDFKEVFRLKKWEGDEDGEHIGNKPTRIKYEEV